MFARNLGLFAISLSLSACATMAGAQEEPADGAILSTQAKIDAALAATTNGISTFPVPTDGGAIAILAHREKDGGVEVHDVLSDLLVGREGSADLIIGGRHVDGRQSAPGEWRSGRIEGGRRVRLGPGDMIWIPAGVPHQMLMVDGGNITYLALKYAAKSPASAAQ